MSSVSLTWRVKPMSRRVSLLSQCWLLIERMAVEWNLNRATLIDFVVAVVIDVIVSAIRL